MRIVTMTVILGLPLMALGQQAEPQQTQGRPTATDYCPSEREENAPRAGAEQTGGET